MKRATTVTWLAIAAGILFASLSGAHGKEMPYRAEDERGAIVHIERPECLSLQQSQEHACLRVVYEEAMDLFRNQQTNRAIERITIVIKMVPRAHGMYADRGVMHAHLGDLDTARQDFLAGLKIAPTFAPLWILLARLELQAGRLLGAQEAAAVAVQIEPHNPAIHYLRDHIGQAVAYQAQIAAHAAAALQAWRSSPLSRHSIAQ